MPFFFHGMGELSFRCDGHPRAADVAGQAGERHCSAGDRSIPVCSDLSCNANDRVRGVYKNEPAGEALGKIHAGAV